MARPSAGLDQTLQVRADADLVDMIDNWRRQQPDLPSRAEAIRRLVRQAISSVTPVA